MKNTTGIIRKFDELGRLTVPIEMRRHLGIAERTPVEIALEGNCIVIRKDREACTCCGSYDDLITAGGVKLCRGCARSIIRLMEDKP